MVGDYIFLVWGFTDNNNEPRTANWLIFGTVEQAKAVSKEMFTKVFGDKCHLFAEEFHPNRYKRRANKLYKANCYTCI